MRILTYNICALPVLTGDITARMDLIGRAAAALDPDIIVLQEVYLGRHLHLLARRLGTGWKHRVAEPRAWNRYGGGLVLFSKLPIEDAAYKPFKEQGAWLRYSFLAKFSKKGYFSVRVRDAVGNTFRLVATHLIADYRRAKGEGDRDPYLAFQERQVEELRGVISNLGRAEPMLVCGDLNMTPRSPLLTGFLRKTGLQDSMNGVVSPSLIRERYYRIPFDGTAHKRLDYVLHRAGRERGFEVKAARYVLERPVQLTPKRALTLSDHYGVLVEMDWRRRNGAA